MKSTRREILIVVDRPDWAIDRKASNLERLLGVDYRIVKKIQSEVTAADIETADLVQVFYWMQFAHMPHLTAEFERIAHKLLIGICGHVDIEGGRREPGLKWLRKGRAIFVANQLLLREARSLFSSPIFCTPNGVDTNYFRPPDTSCRSATPLRVGWAGSLTNHGAEQRGFDNLIIPAVNAVRDVELVTAIREDKWRGQNEMLAFYRSLDIYVCASRNEGTPNPCLEAAACRVPIVTTRVGTMPEFINHGRNGLFIEPCISDLAAKLKMLRDARELRQEMGAAAREVALSWDWSLMAPNFRAMYETLLAPGARSPSANAQEPG